MRAQAIDSLAAWPADLIPPRGVLVLSGYGLDIRVWRGRLRVIDDGRIEVPRLSQYPLSWCQARLEKSGAQHGLEA